jgi:hypothetical protein
MGRNLRGSGVSDCPINSVSALTHWVGEIQNITTNTSQTLTPLGPTNAPYGPSPSQAFSSASPRPSSRQPFSRPAGARAAPLPCPRHARDPAPGGRGPPRHTHPLSSIPAGDPSPFNHLAGAEARLQHPAAAKFPQGERGTERAGSSTARGRTDGRTDGVLRVCPRPLPPHVPMHLLARGGGAGPVPRSPRPRPAAHSQAGHEGVQHGAGTNVA